MKKLITFSIFAFALMFSTQTLSAQTTLEINAKANEQTKELRKEIKFEQEKMHDVYEAYREYGIAYKKIKDNLSANEERLQKINRVFDERLQVILTADQFARYMELYRSE